MRSYKVLSTKKLTPPQHELLLETNIFLQEYNAISIHKLSVKEINTIDNAIVTSQNSAKILIESKAQLKNVFCVGEKTSALFLKKGYNVVKIAKNATELADFIVKNTKKESFVFYCGNKRRDELPSVLSENKIIFTEKILYKTVLNPQKIETKFDAVLFFSPSGVESYVQQNSLENRVAFCIGKTTANEAKKYTASIVVAQQSTIENTITTAIDYFKS